MSIVIPDITSSIGSNITQSYTQYYTTMFTAIATGIVLLVTLAWNDVIQTTIKQYYPRDDVSITGKLQYALVITFIVILLQIYILPLIMDTKKKC